MKRPRQKARLPAGLALPRWRPRSSCTLQNAVIGLTGIVVTRNATVPLAPRLPPS